MFVADIGCLIGCKCPRPPKITAKWRARPFRPFCKGYCQGRSETSKGDADINVVLKDILALTKLNYNTCIFGDGMPITLKFADAVGEILTAGPIKDVPPLPFGHYI